jgi:O-antigen biosynthesis protein
MRFASLQRVATVTRALLKNPGAAFENIRYQIARALILSKRTLASLRSRGIASTWEKISGTLFRPNAAFAALQLPARRSAFLPFAIDSIKPEASLLVSIIIPVFNKFDYTDACLRSLQNAAAKVSFEIIVVDDCSSDASWANLQQISGITTHRNALNLGFIGSCNAGLKLAKGEFVVFLNNDTAVQPGWLEALVDTFASHPDAGLVGAKLVYPDGRLQECGGIVFQDGNAWNYGRFEAPSDGQFCYVREVDYCSGAAIMLRRALLNALGGFDMHYAPAYYEDTDLAFKVRAAGLKVYVQPQAVVVHFEGISSGTDVSAGIKRFQAINKIKFFERWQSVLRTHPKAPPDVSITLAREHRAIKRILVVDATTPMPDQDSGSLRMFNLLVLLKSEGHAVTFFCEGRTHHPAYALALQQAGVEVLYAPFMPNEARFLSQRGNEFDAVILSRHYVATPLLRLVRKHCPSAKVIFDTVDLHFLRERRQAALSHDASLLRQSQNTERAERALIESCDLTWVVSHVEQSLLQAKMPKARVAILSNIHDIPGRLHGYADRQNLLFIGGFQHPPNVDAVLWFVQSILPLVNRTLPELKLQVVGGKMPSAITQLASVNVEILGFVPDIAPLLGSAKLSIAPLRYGAGVKGKVNMSMAHGLPVVATSTATEGMHCKHDVDVLIADDPDGFAAAIVRAYSDPALWLSLSDAGIGSVTQHFSIDVARLAVREALG